MLYYLIRSFYLIYLIPLFLLGYLIFRAIRGKRKVKGIKEKNWYLQLSLSKEDFVSQFFFLISIFFLGVTLLAFNKDLGEPLSWRTILLLVSVIGLIMAYYFKVIYTLIISLVGFTVWWISQAIEWIEIEGVAIRSIVLFVGFIFIATIFYLLSHVHEKEIRLKRVSIVYLILGLISIISVLFYFSTDFGLKTLEKTTKGVSFFASMEITLSFLIFLSLIIGLLIYTLRKDLIFKSEAMVIGFLVILFCIIALIPEQIIFLQKQNYFYGSYRDLNLSSGGIFWAILFNILIFLKLVGIIFLGYLKQENWLISLGIFLLFILIFIKYFDWFFAFLDKSVFFISAGILLITIGWFMEKGRRRLLANVKKKIDFDENIALNQ